MSIKRTFKMLTKSITRIMRAGKHVRSRINRVSFHRGSAVTIDSTTHTTSNTEKGSTRSPSTCRVGSSGTLVCADATIEVAEIPASDCPPSATAHAHPPKSVKPAASNSLFISSPARAAVRAKHNVAGKNNEATGTSEHDKELSLYECTLPTLADASVLESAVLSFDNLYASMTASYVAQATMSSANNLCVVVPEMVPFDIDSPPLKSTSGNSKTSSGDKEGATARTSTCASSSLAPSGVGLSAPSASLANARYALLGKYSDATTGFDAALQTAPMRGRTVARTPGCSRVSLFRQDRRATSALSQVYVYADIIQVDVARWKPSTARSPTQANGPRQAALQPLLDRIQELCTPLGE